MSEVPVLIYLLLAVAIIALCQLTLGLVALHGVPPSRRAEVLRAYAQALRHWNVVRLITIAFGKSKEDRRTSPGSDRHS